MIRPRLVFAILSCLCLSVEARTGEEKSLFNGKDLTDWVVEGNPGSLQLADGRPVWTVKEGNIHCAGKGFGFLRYNAREFGDFRLHVEFRMAAKCNSGIGVRTRVYDPAKSRETRPSLYSYEIQLIDDQKPLSVHSTGSLYRYVAPSANALKPAGEWNTIEITCVGPKIQVVLNSQKIIDVDQTTIEAIKNKPMKGFVCLQNHGGEIEFRSVRILEIEGSSRSTSRK